MTAACQKRLPPLRVFLRRKKLRRGDDGRKIQNTLCYFMQRQNRGIPAIQRGLGREGTDQLRPAHPADFGRSLGQTGADALSPGVLFNGHGIQIAAFFRRRIRGDECEAVQQIGGAQEFSVFFCRYAGPHLREQIEKGLHKLRRIAENPYPERDQGLPVIRPDFAAEPSAAAHAVHLALYFSSRNSGLYESLDLRRLSMPISSSRLI